MTISLKVGGKYENGHGAVRPIVSAPSDKCRWFKDDLDICYHETGEMVRVNGYAPELNLVAVISEPVHDCDAAAMVDAFGSAVHGKP